jgi:hypothetical protein
LTSDQRLLIILTFVSAIGIPSFVFSYRVTAKWTRVEERLQEMVRSMGKLVEDKDKVHAAIQQEIRDDRAATNLRLRWLEEHLWGKGRNTNG